MKSNKCTKDIAYNHFSNTLWKEKEITNQISDLFGGLSQNKCIAKYGHRDLQYWNDGSLAREAFAHMFECQFDKARYNLMQQYFPTALAEFEKILGGII